ncbi:MAG: DUF1643 domain-containing protein [Bacteroidetes bacterium]|nr:DUF1643 domain-containing protein [Bacteroidota bacterium]
MEYQPNIYLTNQTDTYRYALGMEGKKMLAVMGLNPSKANLHKPDTTLRKVLGFAERNGYNGFIMLNICAKRETFPNNLPKHLNQSLHQKNLNTIKTVLAKHAVKEIWAAWGNIIEVRPYLKQALNDIFQMTYTSTECNWIQLGELTKGGHPRHPSRAGYELSFLEFNIENYLK